MCHVCEKDHLNRRVPCELCWEVKNVFQVSLCGPCNKGVCGDCRYKWPEDPKYGLSEVPKEKLNGLDDFPWKFCSDTCFEVGCPEYSARLISAIKAANAANAVKDRKA
jgi:hypothetical protein